MGKKLFISKVVIVGTATVLLLYTLGWFGYTLLNDALTDLFNWFMNILPNKYLVSISAIVIIIIVLIFGLRVSFKKIKQKLPF